MKKHHAIVLVWSFLCCVTCSDDRNVFQPAYIDIETAVTSVTVDGAVFTAKILDRTAAVAPIDDRGFEWGLESASVGKDDGSEEFNLAVTSTLIKDVTYSVRAYVISNKIKIYGNPVKFTSQGSKGPVITDFSPKSVHLLDTVTITGTSFSSRPNGNVVTIGATTATQIFVSNNLIKIVVPSTLADGSYSVTVRSAGIATVAVSQLQVVPGLPFQLTAVDKTTFGLCDDLVLTVNNLPAYTPNMAVKFNSISVTPTLRNGNKLTVHVPSTLPISNPNVTLTLAIGLATSTLPNTLTLLQPQITSFSPATYSPGTFMIVVGQNFPTCGLSAKINGSVIFLHDVTTTSFNFTVPPGTTSPFTINLTLNSVPLLNYSF